MFRPHQLTLALLASMLGSPAPAAPATKPAPPQATIRPATWEQDNARMRAQVAKLAATIAEMENRPAPATRPAPASAPTSRPVGLLIAENKRLVGSVNAMLERIAVKNDRPPLSKGVSGLSITFTCQGRTIDEISEFLGMTGQLAAEQEDGKLTYEWLFKILGDRSNKVAEIQPWVCEVVDGKIVSNRMLERRPIGGVRNPPGRGQ